MLSHAARHRIEEMDFDSDIDTHDDYEAVIAMSLPHSLLNSDSLTSLKLATQSLTEIKFPTSIWLPRLKTLKLTMRSSEFEFPTSVWLPSIKTLHIEWFEDCEDLILPNCCPVLQELIVLCRSYYLHIPIESTSLQRLTIESFMPDSSSSSCASIEVNCSNLQSFNICSIRRVIIQVCDLYSLAEADIDMDCTPYLRGSRESLLGRIILGLLESIHHVKSLKLSSSTVEVC
ncbi:F-box protein [Corchorus olitorius]|uniref:F-box protein n=1 Tax=Corchorus olitorius TaxID=93759 RepID=A0A1R3HH84_9ROSI|nr:F-box protein [Corchorus olitorius]